MSITQREESSTLHFAPMKFVVARIPTVLILSKEALLVTRVQCGALRQTPTPTLVD